MNGHRAGGVFVGEGGRAPFRGARSPEPVTGSPSSTARTIAGAHVLAG